MPEDWSWTRRAPCRSLSKFDPTRSAAVVALAVARVAAQARRMLPPEDELRVQVERGRALLRVTASAAEATPRLSVEVTFSSGSDGVWFKLTRGEQTRVFARDTVASCLPLSAILRLIGDEVELSKPSNEALLGLLFRSLLVYVERMTEAVPLPRWGRPVRDRRIERALALLDADLAKYWTVELLARAVGLSRPVFARQFVRMLQVSPMRYLTRRRMQVAAHWLLHTDATLAEVAARVGYQSEFAFGRAFKQHHRVAPGTFRRQATLAKHAPVMLAA